MMARESSRKKEKTLGQRIFGLMLINIIPIGGLLGLAWAFKTERIALEDLPEGVGRPAVGFVIALLVLIVVVSALLPLAHGLTKWLWIQLKMSSVKRQEGGALRTIFEFGMWPFRRVFHLVFWLARFAFYLISFALILACILFLIRTVNPEFMMEQLPLEDWGEEGIEWVRERLPEKWR